MFETSLLASLTAEACGLEITYDSGKYTDPRLGSFTAHWHQENPMGSRSAQRAVGQIWTKPLHDRRSADRVSPAALLEQDSGNRDCIPTKVKDHCICIARRSRYPVIRAVNFVRTSGRSLCYQASKPDVTSEGMFLWTHRACISEYHISFRETRYRLCASRAGVHYYAHCHLFAVATQRY